MFLRFWTKIRYRNA